MRAWIAGSVLAALLASGVPGLAAETERTADRVELWPEYDRPAVLVIHRLSVPPGVDLPARVALRIPAAVGVPHAVAQREADGRLVNLAYEREVEGSWASIAVTARRPAVQIEYYDPRLERVGSFRRFVFQWPGQGDVELVSMLIQQPAGARDVRISPPPSSQATGRDGLLYHRVDLGGSAAGAAVALTLEYENDGDLLSSGTPQPPAATPPPPPSPPARAPSGSQPWVWVAGGTLLLAGMIALALWRRDGSAP